MERFVVLPFTMGCVSQSSIEVGTDPPKKSKTTSDPVAVSSMISFLTLSVVCVCVCFSSYFCVVMGL